MSVRHRKLNPDTIAHLSTNRARRRLTSLIEANALTTTPDHQTIEIVHTDESSAVTGTCSVTGCGLLVEGAIQVPELQLQLHIEFMTIAIYQTVLIKNYRNTYRPNALSLRIRRW